MLQASGSRIKSGMTVVELPGTTSDKPVMTNTSPVIMSGEFMLIAAGSRIKSGVTFLSYPGTATTSV